MRVLVIVTLAFILPGCSRVQYIPAESVRYEDKVHTKETLEYVRDSIFIHQKKDTVFIEKFRTIYKDVLKIDSIVVRDSIQVPYPVEHIVYKNKLRKWQTRLIWLGVISIFICILLLKKRVF